MPWELSGMKLGLASVAALVAIIAPGVRAQDAPPPPPPPPSLLTPNQARNFRNPGLVLRYQFQPGQMQRYRITTDTISRTSPADGGEAVLTKQHIETVISQTVQDIRFPDGIATLILQPESIRIVTNDKPDEISTEQREIYLQERKLQVSPMGKIVNQDTPSGRKVQSSLLDPLIYGFLETQGVFPPDGVHPGEKWSGQSVLRDLNAPVSNVFTVSGIQPTQTGGIVRIDSRMIGPVKESGAKDLPSKGDISGRGEIYFDNTNGVLSNSSLSLHAKLPLPNQQNGKSRNSVAFVKLSAGVVVDRKLTVVRVGSEADNAVVPQAVPANTQTQYLSIFSNPQTSQEATPIAPQAQPGASAADKQSAGTTPQQPAVDDQPTAQQNAPAQP